MAYSQVSGRRPAEYASKSSHTHIISDPEVAEFLKSCDLPKTTDEIKLDAATIVGHVPPKDFPIQHIIAIDGGYSEVVVRKNYPSATMAFFQCGALSFTVSDLEALDAQMFIDPEDISKLKNIQRLKFALPIRTIKMKGQTSFVGSVRAAIHNFFIRPIGDDGENLASALAWLILEEFAGTPKEWRLASCPLCNAHGVPIKKAELKKDFTFPCGACGKDLYLIDALRLHEAIDEEQGAGGILGYLMTTVEQILMCFFIKAILSVKPDLLRHIMFIKDGPLAYFGQTANLHSPMQSLIRYLNANHAIHMAGLEKSGSFVDHAIQIKDLMKPAQVLILDNAYIYTYIIPGDPKSTSPYAVSTYYGAKVIFKTASENMYVVTLPTENAQTKPKVSDLINMHTALEVVQKLRCDMYDNALIPVALANKLVSLSAHPSATILQRFATHTIGH